ncbi:juvenile hormone esterase-like isoform X2 [Microplitis mediator]|uniref:juvenile hormone esterase-like isoform X2 n=1 Tax=Microplitis mediator TaxID=375433 RepID=UPI00255731E9|nr:juvenile hormone esterase-like isoform X2 [Microplitis mediator]
MILIFYIVLFFSNSIVINIISINAELTSVIETEKGPVQGEILVSVNKKIKFSSFRGIRYGKPPIGIYRFKPAEEAEAWEDIFQATSEATPCPQMDDTNGKEVIGDEDCLNLNVYTPKTNFSSYNESLPVMVWIYGGRFKEGSSSIKKFGPDYLIENDVVVVVMNHRLGALGYLSLNLSDASGNAGLKDQVLALKWVQKNIKFFGGDSKSVTIFGQSTGAVAVDFHILSESSRDLFQRSISMSGSSLCFWGFAASSQNEFHAYQVANLLGYKVNDKTELLGILKNESAQNIVKATEKITSNLRPFKPVIEDQNIAGDTAFITKCFVENLKTGQFNQLPHMAGLMSQEILFFLKPLIQLKDSVEKIRNTTGIIGADVPFNLIPTLSNIFGGQPEDIFSDVIDDAIDQIIQNLTDAYYVSAIDTKQQLMQKYVPVYYYRNSIISSMSRHKSVLGISIDGSAHADDLPYIWHVSNFKYPTDPQDPFNINRDKLVRMWTNFAKYSNPTPLGTKDQILNVTWTVSGSEGYHLEINQDYLAMGPRPVDENVKKFQPEHLSSLKKITDCSYN